MKNLYYKLTFGVSTINLFTEKVLQCHISDREREREREEEREGEGERERERKREREKEGGRKQEQSLCNLGKVTSLTISSSVLRKKVIGNAKLSYQLKR